MNNEDVNINYQKIWTILLKKLKMIWFGFICPTPNIVRFVRFATHMVLRVLCPNDNYKCVETIPIKMISFLYFN